MLHKLLYFAQAPWEIGEHEDARDARIARGDAVDFADLYPGSCAGWIISVIPATRDFSPGELAHPCRAVLELDLTAEELSAVRRRECCVVAGALEPVTFEHRFGAIAAGLRAAFPDPEDLEANETQRIDEAIEENRRRAQICAEEFAVWKESQAIQVEEGGLVEPVAEPTPAPTPPAMLEIPEPVFAEKVGSLARRLPRTVVHTGAGLYKVDASGSTHNDTIAGFVKNLLLQSNMIGVSPWDLNGVASLIEAASAIGPDGTLSARRVYDNPANGNSPWILQSVAATAGLQYTLSAWIKKRSSHVGTISLALWDNVTTWQESDISAQVSDTTWTRVSKTATFNAGATSMEAGFGTTMGVDRNFDVWGMQLELAATPSPYIPTQATTMHAITLTTGGLTPDERNGEVLVTGGNSYPVIKAYAAQVNVVGDPTAEAGALTISPYTTIQSALDQLWTDQGATAFTAEQEIRIYDDTYTECITLNGALVPMSRYHLKLSAAVGNSPVLDCTGETNAILTAAAIEFVDFEGLTILGTCTANWLINFHYSSRQIVFRECTIAGDSLNHIGVSSSYGYMYFLDCDLSGEDGLTSWFEYLGHAGAFIRCHIHDFSLAVRSIRAPLLVEGCTIHDCGYFCSYTATNYYGSLRFVQNTVYNMTSAFLRMYTGNENPLLEIRNNIFHTVPVFLYEHYDYAKFDQVRCVIDSNCYYNVTKWLDSVHDADVTTFAAWQALGWDANSIEADPLLTDPAAGDFSLQIGSPCRHAGVGSGVFYDVDGDAFDPYHPDIGAVSTGIGPNVAYSS